MSPPQAPRPGAQSRPSAGGPAEARPGCHRKVPAVVITGHTLSRAHGLLRMTPPSPPAVADEPAQPTGWGSGCWCRCHHLSPTPPVACRAEGAACRGPEGGAPGVGGLLVWTRCGPTGASTLPLPGGALRLWPLGQPSPWERSSAARKCGARGPLCVVLIWGAPVSLPPPRTVGPPRAPPRSSV